MCLFGCCPHLLYLNTGYYSTVCVFSLQWKTLLDKRGSVPGDGSISHTDTAPKKKEVQDFRHSDFIPDGAYELLQCSKTSSGDEIVWCASDEEGDLQQMN